jgi:glucosamine--fructose-6-phosphate aminotransferase (isomerizing)
MCGIVGGVGNVDFRKYLIEGLKKLDYRGYDSAGLAYQKDGQINCYKIAGRVEALDAIVPPFAGANAGIAHTRWATHGQPSKENAHPQMSMRGEFYIVHNGVIENFRALKNQLIARGYVFASQTDTEVIADMLERNFLRIGSVLDAIRATIDGLQGSFACAILHKGEPNRLYFMKNASPLLLGVGSDASYLGSDALPMVGYTSKFIDLDDGEYGFLTPGGFGIYKGYDKMEPKWTTRSAELLNHDLMGYPHYMLKEIEEIPGVIKRLQDNYFDGEKFLFNPAMLKTIEHADKITFLACGTSYYACLMGVKFMHFLNRRASASIASEFAYDPFTSAKRPVYILLSQSGETADLIKCQKIINARGEISIAVTNSKGSTIERNATYSCLLYAGLEVAVASTKSYVAQVSFLAMLTGALDHKNNVITHLYALSDAIKDVIARKGEIQKLADSVADAKDAFYVGRGNDYLAGMEGALKLKEVSYVHAECYPGGELKHGPIALIEDGTLVIALISDPDLAMAMRNNLEELRARKAHILVISNDACKAEGDAFVTKSCKPYLAAVVGVVVAQYFSYYVALKKGLPIDKPRNLAKSVTVE